jgi:arsenate reductase-like glutaredoxin family protein
MVNVQIFGVKNSSATRAAERFFKERRIGIQFVDLKQKSMAPGEIKRFVDRFGLRGLLDVEGKAYVDDGLKYLKLTDSELLGRIERNPALLMLPLVRAVGPGSPRLAIGHDEDGWKAMLA